MVVVEVNCGGHHAMAVASDAISTGAGDLGDEPVAAEFDDQAGDLLASSVGLVTVDWWATAVPPSCPRASDRERITAAQNDATEPDREAHRSALRARHLAGV